MAKDPAFLFYPGDWLGGTMLMSFEEKGAYISVLMAQFNHGHLPLESIQRVLGADFSRLWDSISCKFLIDSDGKYFNQKLEDEIVKRKTFTESRKNNRKKKTYDASYEKHMIQHMENENENRNISVVENSVTVTSEKNKNQFPDMAAIQGMQLNEMEVQRVGVFVGQRFTWLALVSYWRSFSAKFDGTKFYQDRGAIVSYFMNWLKGELAKVKKPPESGRMTVAQMREIQQQKKKAI